MKNGYAWGTVGGRTRVVHRAMYEEVIGPIPAALQLDHGCRNRRCVNPYLLEPVTQVENIRRADLGARNRRKTHCPAGHRYSPDNVLPNANGWRACAECNRTRSRERYRRLHKTDGRVKRVS